MIQEITERTEIAILDLVQEIVEAPEADPDPEVPWKMETKTSKTTTEWKKTPKNIFDLKKKNCFFISCNFSF